CTWAREQEETVCHTSESECLAAGNQPAKRHQVCRRHYREGSPVPIPNTEVKPRWADGTARVTVWEIRLLPALISRRPVHCGLAFCVLSTVFRSDGAGREKWM